MKLLIRTLVAVVALSTRGAAFADPGDAAAIYSAQCSMCHDVDGKGQTTLGKKVNVKDWSDGTTLNKVSDADASKMIHTGKAMMPGFPAITNDQLAALVRYIRTFQK